MHFVLLCLAVFLAIAAIGNGSETCIALAVGCAYVGGKEAKKDP